jgi:hypothetical protein
VLAELICIPAFIFEVTRALGGNTLSWAYVFEWPLLGLYSVYMWRKLLHEGNGLHAAPVPSEGPEDLELRAWNEYLTKLHLDDQVSESENLLD